MKKPSRAGGTSGQRAACCSDLPSPPQNSPSCLSEPSDLPNIKERALVFANLLIWIPATTYPLGPFLDKHFQGFGMLSYSCEVSLRGPTAAGPALNTKRKATFFRTSLYLDSGNYLSSRAVSSQVLSALKGLTSVFGMGTGGTPSLCPPEIVSDVSQPSVSALSASRR